MCVCDLSAAAGKAKFTKELDRGQPQLVSFCFGVPCHADAHAPRVQLPLFVWHVCVCSSCVMCAWREHILTEVNLVALYFDAFRAESPVGTRVTME
jgi:hypothetical protein